MHVFPNEIKTTVDSGIIIEDVSNHLPIFAMCHSEIDRSKQTHLESGRMCDAGIETLKSKLKNHD